MSKAKQFTHNLKKAKRQAAAERKYYIEDIFNAGINLEPLHCKFCDSKEVVFNQYINDASCQSCGEWQED